MPTERTRVRRQPERGRYSRDEVARVLDSALVAHLAFVDEGQPFCIPFLHVRIADQVFVHGSTASRAMRVLASGAPAALTVTVLDGLVLARSAFDHSANYRSATLIGRFGSVPKDRRGEVLHAFTERLLPGRWDEVRRPTAKELARTAVLSIPVTEASVKVRSGPPSDEGEDDVWGGVIPMVSGFGPAEPDDRARDTLPVPASVHRLYSDSAPFAVRRSDG